MENIVRLGRNDVHLTELEVSIINTHEFMRLRQISHIGSAQFIFISSNLNEFTLALSKLHYADKLLTSIQCSNERRLSQLSRLYALLSGIFVFPFQLQVNLLLSKEEKNALVNEKIGIESSIGGLLLENLGQKDYRALFNLLTVDLLDSKIGGEENLVLDITNSFIGAHARSLIDFANIYSGSSSSFRLWDYLEISTSQQGLRRLTCLIEKNGKFRASIVSELSQILLELTRIDEVYLRNRQAISIAACIWGGLTRAIQQKRLDITSLHKLTDFELLKPLEEIEIPEIKKLASIHERNFALVTELNEIFSNKEKENSRTIDLKESSKVEAYVSEYLNIDDGDFLIFHKDIQSFPKHTDILVKDGNGVSSYREYIGRKENFLLAHLNKSENDRNVMGFINKRDKDSLDKDELMNLPQTVTEYIDLLKREALIEINSRILYIRFNPATHSFSVSLKVNRHTYYANGQTIYNDKFFLLSYSSWSNILGELEDLINNQKTAEADLQLFLTKYPELLAENDNVAIIPQAIIPREDGKAPWKMDFVKAPYDESEESTIIEIKVPKMNLVNQPKSGHVVFSAKVLHAVQQVRDYGDSFQSMKVSDSFQDVYGYRVHKPNLHVIAGRKPNISEVEVLNSIDKQRKSYPVLIEDWDTFLARKKQQYPFPS